MVIKKNRLECTSKNYFARLKVMFNERDGEYLDVVLGNKNKMENRTHYGLRVIMNDKGKVILGNLFFRDRGGIRRIKTKCANVRTGEVIHEREEKIKEMPESNFADIDLQTRWMPEKKQLLVEKITIKEYDKVSISFDYITLPSIPLMLSSPHN